MTKRHILTAAAAGMSLGLLAGAGHAQQTPSGPRADTALIAGQAGDLKTEMGVIDGATFRIDVPKAWNHGLVIMNHGYSAEPRKPQPGAPSTRVKLFLDRGYAVAQSSYSKGGWAAEQAVQDNEKLRQYFVKHYGKTSSLWAVGSAMGGSITMISVEMFPKLYDGGLDYCCGSLAPSLEGMNASFRTLALFDYYFPGILPPMVGPLNGYTFGAPNGPDAKIKAAFEADPQKAEEFRKTTNHRLADLPNFLAFQNYVVHEAEERAGGNPFDNQTYVYYVDGNIEAVNDGVKRYAADPKARAYLTKWYTPTGKPLKPLFIMSPVYDPVVNIETNVLPYMDLVRETGSNNVVFQFYNNEGHGSTTDGEVGPAFDALVAWAKRGPKPKTGPGVTVAAPPRAGRGPGR